MEVRGAADIDYQTQSNDHRGSHCQILLSVDMNIIIVSYHLPVILDVMRCLILYSKQ